MVSDRQRSSVRKGGVAEGVADPEDGAEGDFGW